MEFFGKLNYYYRLNSKNLKIVKKGSSWTHWSRKICRKKLQFPWVATKNYLNPKIPKFRTEIAFSTRRIYIFNKGAVLRIEYDLGTKFILCADKSFIANWLLIHFWYKSMLISHTELIIDELFTLFVSCNWVLVLIILKNSVALNLLLIL